MLKIVLVAHLTYENQWDKLHTKIQTFFLGLLTIDQSTLTGKILTLNKQY